MRILWYIGRWEGPSLSLLLEYTLITLVGKSLSLIDVTKLLKLVWSFNGWILGLSLVLLLRIYEGNVVGAILGKRLEFTITAADGLTISWSLGTLLGMLEGLLLVIVAGGKLGTPLGCWVWKWLCFILVLNIFNTVGIVLGICDDFLLGFVLGKNN